MATLAELVLKLSRDPQELEAFKRDQAAYLDAADLPSEDRVVLESGDPKKIRELITTQQGSPTAEYEWVIVLINVQVTTKAPMTEEA